MSIEKLKEFLSDKGIEVDFFTFENSTQSVKESSERLDVSYERIVKSLVLKDEEGLPIIALVPGNKKLSMGELSQLHGSRVEMAEPDEIKTFSGYELGGIPPISHRLKTYIDEDIMQFESVVAGGGSSNTLMKISTEDIVDITDCRLDNISN